MGVEVTVLRAHAWRHKDYQPGDRYVVEGDAFTTETQYLDTLTTFGLSKPTESATPAKPAKPAGRKAGAV